MSKLKKFLIMLHASVFGSGLTAIACGHHAIGGIMCLCALIIGAAEQRVED